MSGALERAFREAVFQERIALLMARGLAGTERQVGLFMVELINRDRFFTDQVLCCWPGTTTIAKALDCTPRAARKSRAALVERGALSHQAVSGRDGIWFFPPEWARDVLSGLAKDDIKHPWLGLETRNSGSVSDAGSGIVVPLKRNTRSPNAERSGSAMRNARSTESIEENLLKESGGGNVALSAEAGDAVTMLLGKLRARLGSTPVRAWIEPAQPLIADGTIELTATSPASADWIGAHRSDIEACTGLRLVLKRSR